MGGSARRSSASRTPTDEKQLSLQKSLEGHASASGEAEPDWGDQHENFDEIYENTDESELGNVQQQHGSVLMHLLSQVSVGMDLTKVTLPTFILERRSLLEMYAEFFSHPEDFIQANVLSTPEERIISVVRYYLNAFYPARKSGVAKKPYNPVLGETFRCRWKVPGLNPSGRKTESGPFPGSDLNQVKLNGMADVHLILGHIYCRTGFPSPTDFCFLRRASGFEDLVVCLYLDEIFVFGAFNWWVFGKG
jgi:hypothetical protein